MLLFGKHDRLIPSIFQCCAVTLRDGSCTKIKTTNSWKALKYYEIVRHPSGSSSLSHWKIRPNCSVSLPPQLHPQKLTAIWLSCVLHTLSQYEHLRPTFISPFSFPSIFIARVWIAAVRWMTASHLRVFTYMCPNTSSLIDDAFYSSASLRNIDRNFMRCSGSRVSAFSLLFLNIISNWAIKAFFVYMNAAISLAISFVMTSVSALEAPFHNAMLLRDRYPSSLALWSRFIFRSYDSPGSALVNIESTSRIGLLMNLNLPLRSSKTPEQPCLHLRIFLLLGSTALCLTSHTLQWT